MKTHRFTVVLLLALLLAVLAPAAGTAADTDARIGTADRIELTEAGLWERLLNWLESGLDQLLHSYTPAEGASIGTNG